MVTPSLEEIVAGIAWDDGVEVWKGDSQSLFWSVPVNNLDEVITGDVDGDGQIEVVYGDRQHGGIHILDGATGEEEWGLPNPQFGFDRIAIGDIDDDGVNEIFFSVGYHSTAPNHLFVIDTISRSLVWQSEFFSGPFLGLTEGDVDADGDNELVYSRFERPGSYFVHDAVTKTLEYVGPEQFYSDASGTWDVEVADVDGDPQLEVLFPTGSGILTCWDGVDHSMQWDSRAGTLGSIEVADLDGDTSLEIATGRSIHSSPAPGELAHFYDAEYGHLEWESPNLTAILGSWAKLTLLRVSDVDDDGIAEMVVADHGGDLVVLDSINNTVEVATDGLRITALETANLDSIGPDEIVVGTSGGFLEAVDAATGATVTLAGPFGGPINGLRIIDLTVFWTTCSRFADVFISFWETPCGPSGSAVFSG